jgi:hypothetical protein
MDFLYPMYFAGILTAALPILIHLLTKRQKKRILFSDLRLLRQVDAEEAPRYRWENLILMILRALMCAILALVFCQPVWKAGAGFLRRPGQGTVAAFVIDSSRSMGASEGGVSRYEKAKESALQFLDLLRGDDEVMAVFASSHTRTSHAQPTPFREEVREAIELSKPTPYASSFTSAVQLALDTLLKSPNPGKELYLFTDCQRSALLPAPPASTWPANAGTIAAYFGYLPGAERLSLPNVELANLKISPHSAKPGDPLEVTADVHSYGDGAPVQIEVHLETEPNTRLFKNLNILPGRPNPVRFAVSRSSDPVDLGLIRIQSDVLESDNTIRYALPLMRPIRILLSQGGGGDETLLFLQVALRFLAQLPIVPDLEAEFVPIREIPDALVGSLVDVVIIANPSNVDRGWIQSLSAWMREGGSLVLGMGAVPPARINELMVPEWFPAGIQEWKENPDKPTKPIGFDYSDPWIDRFQDQTEANWQSVSVWGGYEFLGSESPLPNLRPLMVLERGSPLLWKREIGLGNLNVWMSSLDDTWNDVPRSGLFLALWGEFFRSLAERKGLSPSFVAGSQVAIEAARIDDRPSELEVIDPAGRKHALTIAGPRMTQSLYFSKTDQVGVYKVEYDANKVDRVTPSSFAVNIEPGEGDLTGLPVDEVEKLFPFPIQRIENRENLAAQISHSRYGYGLWPYVLFTLMALFLVEAWIGRPTT